MKDVGERFKELNKQWQEGTLFVSSVSMMVEHPAYREIIAMGRPVLPFILKELEDKPDHWFWALRNISGEDPAKGMHNFDDAREAWLAWGRKQGHLG